MPIKSDIKESSKKINQELFSLNPSTLITLFEIDVSSLTFNKGIAWEENDKGLTSDFIFRFHNNVKLINNSITWRGADYTAVPIHSEGWEFNGKGTLPTPKLSLTVSDDGIPLMASFKDKLKQLGDLTGAIVTRIRTFAKYLDAGNFIPKEVERNGVKYLDSQIIIPEGFAPDPNAELPRDIYFIDRKSNENKNNLEFELGSILDIENLKLPGRLVVSTKCSACYRGEGCLYEYESRRVPKIHGTNSKLIPDDTADNHAGKANAVATSNDESIASILKSLNNNTEVQIIDRGQFDIQALSSYIMGNQVFIQRNRLLSNGSFEAITQNFYFVCKVNAPLNGPPDSRYWIADDCSKNIKGCKFRYGLNGKSGITSLMFSGFPATNRLIQ